MHFWRAGAIQCTHVVRLKYQTLRKIGIYVEHYSMYVRQRQK